MSEKFSGEISRFTPQAYDEHLYDSFVEQASLSAYEYLNGDPIYRKEQKELFLSGAIKNPELDYPFINLEQLSQVESNLLSMKQDIISNEQNEVIKQTYRWRLNEKIAEVRMLKAAASGNMNRFQRYCDFIYGKPSPDVFAYTVNSIRTKAIESVNSENETISSVASNLLKLLPELPNPKISELPDEATVNYAHIQTVIEFGNLINFSSDETKLDAYQIQEAFEVALEEIDNKDGWQVSIDNQTSRTAVSVNQEEMQINIPENRKAGTAKLKALIVHEIGTHVARRINGERSKLKLLGLGLDRYEAGDEGVATMREQAIAKKADDFSGLAGHFAIGLAQGLDGQPRDFRQVYEVLENYYLLNNLVSGKEVSEAREKAQNTAWNRSVRTFKGTDCKTPGVCFTKDIIYRQGNIGVWDVIRNNPAEMIHFNIGKYDPSNIRHLWVLEQLGITEQDLTYLENENYKGEEEEEEEEETEE